MTFAKTYGKKKHRNKFKYNSIKYRVETSWWFNVFPANGKYTQI